MPASKPGKLKLAHRITGDTESHTASCHAGNGRHEASLYEANLSYVMFGRDDQVILYVCKVDTCKYETVVMDDRPYHMQAQIMNFECEDGVPFETEEIKMTISDADKRVR